MLVRRWFLVSVAAAALGLIAGRAAWAQAGGDAPSKEKESPKVEREAKPDEPTPPAGGPSRREGNPPRGEFRPGGPARGDAADGQRGGRRAPRDGQPPRDDQGPRDEQGDGPRRPMPPQPGGPGMPGMGPGGPGMPGMGPGGPGMGPGGPGMGPGGPGMGPGPRPDGGPRPEGGPMGGRGFGQPNWEEMERRDPEMAKLMRAEMEIDGMTRDLAEKCRGAQGSERETIKTKLKEVVSKQFEIRQERRQLELVRLEKELKRLHDAIESRKKNSEEIIARRLGELVGQPDDTGF